MLHFLSIAMFTEQKNKYIITNITTFVMLRVKTIKIGQCFTELFFKNYYGTFLREGVGT